MKKFLLFFFLHFSVFLAGQTKFQVVDETTLQPLPYVLVYNEHVMLHSDDVGFFVLPKERLGEAFNFEALGYEKHRLSSLENTKTIYLQASVQHLPEMVIKPRYRTLFNIQDKFVKQEASYSFGVGSVHGKAWLKAKYFKYLPEVHSKTGYIKSVKILTRSALRGSTFNIRLYAATKYGEIGDLLYDKPLLGVSKKGVKTTEIDTDQLDISFPETGLFVVFEWLLLEKNKVYEVNEKQPERNFYYQPFLMSAQTDKSRYAWNKYPDADWSRDGSLNSFKMSQNVVFPMYLISLELSN